MSLKAIVGDDWKRRFLSEEPRGPGRFLFNKGRLDWVLSAIFSGLSVLSRLECWLRIFAVGAIRLLPAPCGFWGQKEKRNRVTVRGSATVTQRGSGFLTAAADKTLGLDTLSCCTARRIIITGHTSKKNRLLLSLEEARAFETSVTLHGWDDCMNTQSVLSFKSFKDLRAELQLAGKLQLKKL